jgi:SAM-dependent methyltransferase
VDNGNKKLTELTIFGLPEEGKVIFRHPWKLSRGDCVLKYLKRRNLHNLADIGVNDMYYTKKLKTFGDGKIYAVDVFFSENGEIKDGIICVNNIEKLPDKEIDCIIMMDVLEHIENDKLFFDIAVKKLKNGGILLITVPAWQFLFSSHDVKLLHFRRYNRKQLKTLIKHDDMKIIKCHYFYTSLFLARLAFIQKKDKFCGNDNSWNYPEKNIITIIIKTVLDIDYWINKILDKIGIHLPGLSLFAICQKNK